MRAIDEPPVERTPAEEVRQAVEWLRCDHRFPVLPPRGSLGSPGPCLSCGLPYQDFEMPEVLKEPLSQWLEHTADAMGDDRAEERHFPDKIPTARYQVVDAFDSTRDEWTWALRTARAILGRSS